jgi:hypothetical protein
MTSAHIAGIPIEESLATVIPVVGIVAVLVGIWLRGLGARMRGRSPRHSSAESAHQRSRAID